jgi:hypothetical protein
MDIYDGDDQGIEDAYFACRRPHPVHGACIRSRSRNFLVDTVSPTNAPQRRQVGVEAPPILKPGEDTKAADAGT